MFGIDKPREFTLEVDGKNFAYWTSLKYRRAIDSVDTCTFTAPFDPTVKAHRNLFRPATFREVILRHAGEVLFTGTMLNPIPRPSESGTTVEVSAYSKCGVWEDVTMPVSSLPLEFNGLKLSKIANALGGPFGLSPDFGADEGALFKKVELDPSTSPLQFIAELAKQRNLVIGANQDGDPLFWKSETSGSPVAILDGNKQPVLDVQPNVNDRGIYSEVTGLVKAKHGRPGSKFSESSPFSEAVRPLVFSLDDTEPADAPNAVKAKLGRSLAEAVSYMLKVGTIYDESDNLWDRNTFVRLKAPDVMIYKPYDFLVRAVTIDVSAQTDSAELELVLPGAFSGEVTDEFPWQEPGLF